MKALKAEAGRAGPTQAHAGPGILQPGVPFYKLSAKFSFSQSFSKLPYTVGTVPLSNKVAGVI